MKPLLTAAFALVVAAPALAQSGGQTKTMPGMGNMQITDHASMTTADGEGVVKAVDLKAGTVTIRHGPISALKWRAMTMAFKADPPSLLKGVSAGQRVVFKQTRMGGSPTLTSIEPK